MQFPNGVNKSNLIKLGVLGAAMYLMNNRNKSQAQIGNKSNAQNSQQQNQQNNQASEKANANNGKPLTPFQMGKALANKFLGRKS